MNTMAESVTTVLSTAAVADARDAARAFLDRLRHPAMAAEAADTVVLVVSELATNAVRHGGGTCTLELTAHGESVEVDVHDSSPHAPRMRTLTRTAAPVDSAGPWSTASPERPLSPVGPPVGRR